MSLVPVVSFRHVSCDLCKIRMDDPWGVHLQSWAWSVYSRIGTGLEPDRVWVFALFGVDEIAGVRGGFLMKSGVKKKNIFYFKEKNKY